VEARPSAVRDEFSRDLDASWAKVADATVDAAARASNWNNWCAWCTRFSVDKFLVGTPQPEHIHALMAFSAKVRAGAFGQGRQIGCQSVATALRHVAQTFVLANYPDPRSGPTAGSELGLAFTRLFHSYRAEDPAPRPQLALPVSVFQDAMTHEGASLDPKAIALADLVVIAFFFLLRVGEHTPPSGNRRTRATQIRRKDMQFWKTQPNGLLARLSPLSTLADLRQADSVTTTLDNQKNGQRDATLHHDATPSNPLCPVQACARRFVQMRTCDPTNPNAILSLYAPGKHVTATQMAKGLQVAAARSMIWLHGYDLKRVGPHSLRASGAMQLKLNGLSDSMIQKLGRWSGKTWLQHPHGQISCLTSGVSARMATPVLHHNIGTRAEA
jgi:hypothetical protein